MPSQYFGSLKQFIEFFYAIDDWMTNEEKAENGRKLSIVIEYCKQNYRRIGRGEDVQQKNQKET